MHHLHFDEIGSTQEYLKQNFEKLKVDDSSILVSTSHQTSGHGRQGNTWIDFKDNLAFSFSLKPSQPTTLTSLEIGIHLAHFFKAYTREKIYLKWPNDIISEENKKCGGIICQLQDGVILAGVGINFNNDNLISQKIVRHSGTFPIGSFSSKLELDSRNKEELPKLFYQYVLSHRLSSDEIIQQWNLLCCHMNCSVTLWENDKITASGQFLGIGNMGQAQLRTEQGEKIDAYTGSLIFNENQ
ncbi:MAG: biotin--[acetyl-CoA-carboxylase] ligase [Bdellovibrio sp. CG12_big_fil_rev_8_21_14_0_65_39_13]|nr:MAG: biotin--[acetyl-CoA-carboxylase] ligase [Bdellovibrio sp. CG22_combo_CG10-13_8_21_14_all_39_27]PIQ62596.1 MAG: biotin--[acetyl-CoA-carboxylase] ligase [Bdellovibrio sp. CG12_big_fil_rev_8_21_14_0_65_39_13]PIR36951.1 MAG: biotin--[acetyl-CoA-carboxylase] ligase [Bdellovibrio sp. CG11_big_fil_rev_8_21_14_0_20_39_38]PJB52377.1 MAG: biotin--[acetyl-CoA-carboxylase] ligase [Bdellovibrio sp. CG_4_9_14_3_um_filter_39_7]